MTDRDLTVQQVDNGFLVTYKCPCTYSIKKKVFVNFKDVVDFAGFHFMALGVGEKFKMEIVSD